MFSEHVTKKLSAYCHGEIAPDESRLVAEHLIACSRCRAQYEEIKLGVKLAERLPQLSAPDSLWSNLQSSLSKTNGKGTSVSRTPRFSFKVWRPAFAGVMAALLLVAGFAALWLYSREARPFWEVARLNGAPMIGSSKMNAKGRLAVGEWLETDSNSRAQIDVGSIGKVEIDPNTRVRLVTTKATEHRLELEHGKMSARIWAPPRLFFVDTPAGVAADLGCAYTLEVDDHGAGLLRVTSGWVALQLKDRESEVPAGASCATRPGIGPGTPYFEDASENFRLTLAEFDFKQHDPNELTPIVDTILRDARPRDTLTLWHLLGRVEGNDRVRIYERMAAFAPPPAGVTREGVLQLNEPMLQLWKEKLETTWGDESISGVSKASIKIWTLAVGKANGFEGKR
jgi:hypothetical protein